MGGWTISEATIELFRLVLQNKDVEYVHLISGQDWIGQSVDQICKFYENNKQIYMLYSKAIDSFKSGEHQILWQKYYWNYDKINRRTWFGKIYHRIHLLISTIRKVDKFKDLNINLEIYQGPNWMDLPRDVVEYLLSYLKNNVNVYKLFSTGYCPDEFWVQTILCNNPEYKDRIVQDYHRFILWEKKHDSYPAVLDEKDFIDIKNGNYHFIRKVDSNISRKLIEQLEKE